MKINKLSYISLLVAGMMTVSSCSDILDTPPTTSPSESIFWQSKSDFDSALTGCYQAMQAKTLSYGMVVYDCLTDNGYGSSGSSYVYKTDLIQADNIDAAMDGFVPELYKEAYAAIARMNIFLYQLENYQGGDMSSIRSQYEGEILFLRSYCYYLLYLCYGEVPYPTVPLNLTTQNMPKETLENVYKNLIADLQTAFWMAEIEVSNEQFRTIYPDHNSRFINQLWKDHVHEGYPANKPEQPAIRVSWEEAMTFCEELSRKTGLKVTLPTEVQWEWACRAGSDSDFWFGALNTDFSAYENMADKQLNKLAVRGVDPQPMSPTDPWYKYYTYQPKDNQVDDGNMLKVKGGGYRSNPWGLYDMQGNVAEWTRSDYLPYPYNEKVQGSGLEKVVRGGSWIDHPKTATAYYRRSYLPWQKVHNVGFRVIIED